MNINCNTMNVTYNYTGAKRKHPTYNYIAQIQKYTEILDQNTKDTNDRWREGKYTYHPLTQRQYLTKNIKKKDIVYLKVKNDLDEETHIKCEVISINSYDTVEKMCGPYNHTNKFCGYPFKFALTLKRLPCCA